MRVESTINLTSVPDNYACKFQRVLIKREL